MILKNKKSRWILVISFLVIGVVVGGYFTAPYYKLMKVGNAMNSMMLCSGVFISGREANDVLNQDLAPYKDYPFHHEIDYKNKAVTSSSWGLAEGKVIYRDGGGCTTVLGMSEEDIRAQRIEQIERLPKNPREIPWPTGDLDAFDPSPKGVNMEILLTAIKSAFEEPEVNRPRWTRAILVIYKGKIIAESYAPGITKDTAHIVWSMSKSITSALAGILVGQGKLSLEKGLPFEEWSAPGDRRREITLRHILHMSSGLDFHESTGANVNDTSNMLFGLKDPGGFAIRKQLINEPGNVWAYTSGSAVLIYEAMQRLLSEDENVLFPRKELFNKLGMRSAVINLDPSGGLLGTVFALASARDWARFGLLYMNDGVWEGERILPEGWVAFTKTPTKSFNEESGGYGAQFWTNKPYDEKHGKLKWPAVPREAFYMDGHEKNHAVIIPSKELIVVRLGATHEEFGSDFDMGELLSDLLKAFN